MSYCPLAFMYFLGVSAESIELCSATPLMVKTEKEQKCQQTCMHIIFISLFCNRHIPLKNVQSKRV